MTSSGLEAFHLVDEFDSSGLEASTVEIRVPVRFSGKAALLDFYASRLQFPWFGHNWDALEDCLRDLQWIGERMIVLLHAAIPDGLSPGDLKSYLEILRDCALFWRGADEHQFIVVFPATAGQTLQQVLYGDTAPRVAESR